MENGGQVTKKTLLRTLCGFVVAAVACRGYSPRAAIYPLRSIIELDTIAGTVALPLHAGRVGSKLVWYIVTESSDKADAELRGVTWAPRMAALAGTPAAQDGVEENSGIRFGAGVDFRPAWGVRANPDSAFPPAYANPGSVGESGYSPFVRLPNGVVLNAPIIGDERNILDRVARLDIANMRAHMRLARGYGSNRHVWYISTDASDPAVAAMERSTWVPNLAKAPAVASYAPNTARFYLLAVVNGATGKENPERQGLASALADGLAPLNVLHGSPDPGSNDHNYTPLWDLHLARWTPAAIAADQRVKIFTFDEAKVYAERGWIVSAAPGTANPFLGGITAVDVVINCQVMASFARQSSQ
jgi:hypothetical protein